MRILLEAEEWACILMPGLSKQEDLTLRQAQNEAV